MNSYSEGIFSFTFRYAAPGLPKKYVAIMEQKERHKCSDVSFQDQQTFCKSFYSVPNKLVQEFNIKIHWLYQTISKSIHSRQRQQECNCKIFHSKYNQKPNYKFVGVHLCLLFSYQRIEFRV